MSHKKRQDIIEQLYRRKRRWLFAKEVTLLVLVGVVAGLSMYVARDDSTALGLLPGRPALADQLPVIRQFRTSVLVSEPFLELDIRESANPASQVEGRLFDPTDPPPVTDLNVLNTRIGNEVALFWSMPEDILRVSIYRTELTDVDEETQKKRNTEGELIAEDVTGNSYIDDTVEDGVVYQYEVVSQYDYKGKVYLGSGVVETVIPSDEVPPAAPTNVIVRSRNEGKEAALEVLWVHPTAEDFDLVRVYRSSTYGNRGEEVAVVRSGQTGAYLDTEVDPNERYYYTVVAYDEAGNASSIDFQAPAPGNTAPFEPFSVNPVTGEVIPQ